MARHQVQCSGSELHSKEDVETWSQVALCIAAKVYSRGARPPPSPSRGEQVMRSRGCLVNRATR